MPTIDTAYGKKKFCVLIPSRQRARVLAKTLSKMPWLIHPDTYLGIERAERFTYRAIFDSPVWVPGIDDANGPQWVEYDNPTGSVAVAREQLRKIVVGAYDYYVVTDDNAVHQTEQGLDHLVRAAAEWPNIAVMAGMHNTAAHFDRGRIPFAQVVNGLRSYPQIGMIFQVYPQRLYHAYTYPPDSYGLDDRHFALWMINRGENQFRVCMGAPFTKSRYQEGGQGPIEERMVKNGHAIARLATDFPDLVGATGTLRIPWQFLLEMKKGNVVADRLPGGAMRKQMEVLKPKAHVRVRVRRNHSLT